MANGVGIGRRPQHGEETKYIVIIYFQVRHIKQHQIVLMFNVFTKFKSWRIGMCVTTTRCGRKNGLGLKVGVLEQGHGTNASSL